MNEASGSPLTARQNPFIYLIIVYLLIAIGILFLIVMILKIIQKKHSSPKYIEAQKNRLTSYRDVSCLAKKIHLSKKEAALLWKICRNTQAKNIFYNYTDEYFIDSIFKSEYRHFINSKAKPVLIYDLFKLRFQIYKAVFVARSITSSFNIPVGTVLEFPAPSGFFYHFKLVKNDKNGLLLAVPDAFEENTKDKPEKLTKIALLFTLKNNQQYAMISRVVQFLTMPDGKRMLLVTHSNTLCPQSRRTSRRFTVNRECLFSAVEIIQNKDGGKTFRPKEKTYKGTLADLSEGGCKLFTNLPIKQKQFIYLKFDILDRQEALFGQIVNTRTDVETGLYSIHVMFKNISVETKGKILADLYEYED